MGSSILVEGEDHEVLAERLVRAVGDPRRVPLGTDRGFDTSADGGGITPDVVWAKLGSLAEGARLPPLGCLRRPIEGASHVLDLRGATRTRRPGGNARTARDGEGGADFPGAPVSPSPAPRPAALGPSPRPSGP
ncbi:hypothetical protein [Dankookia sp. P2]|uniref:hypothetical protein n=1 Tax=Dankookia sp. P2 TaxID=3423955 RepID=UPI003D672733